MSEGYNSLTELCARMGRGKVLYQWTPEPIGDDPNHCDIPGEYAVVELPGRADRVMIVGTYRGQWHCNAVARLLVAHLLDEITTLRSVAYDALTDIGVMLDRDHFGSPTGCVPKSFLSQTYQATRDALVAWDAANLTTKG